MTQAATSHNIAEYSVSEISGALKRVVEEKFGYIRVRGEISGLKVAASGHCYLSLKDEKSVLSGICWKGSMAKLTFQPEDGLEVIVTGKLTTYPGRSNYQIVIERMEPAGAGALMALLEKRKKALAAEGLFAPEHKKPLPYLPQTIGVITSPTGAVIRDILHRLADRFPCHVLLWPVAVQGDSAASQITAAIEGFNAHHSNTPIDLIIVARGGGSVEDLWPFNEENVVRAVAASHIPVISAVGHETDTTLIDYVADQRAPTPTAAAEMAVPVLSDLRYMLGEQSQRMSASLNSQLARAQHQLDGLARGLPRPQELLARAEQDTDRVSEQLHRSALQSVETRTNRLQSLAALLVHPREQLTHKASHLSNWSDRLTRSGTQLLDIRQQPLRHAVERLRPTAILAHIAQHSTQLTHLSERADSAWERLLTRTQTMLTSLAKQLHLLDYHQVLERGFALVRDHTGQLITNSNAAQQANNLTITFHDGDYTPNSDQQQQSKPTVASSLLPAKPTRNRIKPAPKPTNQGDLF